MQDNVARGKYLVTVAGCNDCHTPWKTGPAGPEPDMSRMLSGHPESLTITEPAARPTARGSRHCAHEHRVLRPWGVSFTANLTPDAETGLGKWTQATFMQTIRTGRHMGRGRKILPPMPIPMYKNFTDEDLAAIFTYLQSIPPMNNRVPEPLPPARQRPLQKSELDFPALSLPRYFPMTISKSTEIPMTIQRTTTNVAAALALLLSATGADAMPITVDFTVTGNDVSNPAYGSGVTGGSGYFTFDDALMPVGGSGLVGNPILGLPTIDLFFSWFGVSFDETNAKIGTLSFTDGGRATGRSAARTLLRPVDSCAMRVHVERRRRAGFRRARIGRHRAHRCPAQRPGLRSNPMVGARRGSSRARHACAVRCRRDGPGAGAPPACRCGERLRYRHETLFSSGIHDQPAGCAVCRRSPHRARVSARRSLRGRARATGLQCDQPEPGRCRCSKTATSRLTESSAILKYLAEKAGSPAYPHESAAALAHLNERMDWFNTSLSRELCYGFVYPQVMPTHKRPDEHAQRQTLAWARRNAVRWLDVLNERWLGTSNRFVCGERITIADYLGIAHITVGEVARVDYARWPMLRWIARMKDRPTWAPVNDAFYKYLVQPNAQTQFEALYLR